MIWLPASKNLDMKIFKTKAFILPCILILTILSLQYVVNTKYVFHEPQAFKGDYLYNPYKDMDSRKWKMANFHAHTRLLFGLTNGASNFDPLLESFYKYFNYNIIGISNYQYIDHFGSMNEWFVPLYEHGYQYYKNHQLVINAKKVSWLDFVFRQTLSNKQFVIDHLKKDTSVILTIVHPDKRQAYLFNDFKYLANYDCLEIANNEKLFTSYYDTILSAGHPVFLMADDDTHDLTKINDGCQSFNLINADLVKDSILHAIKTGCLVGVNLNFSSVKTHEERRSQLEKLPEITGITLNGDTLKVSFNQPVKTIKFIGQNGVERKKITNSAMGYYLFNKQDTYIRTEIECQDDITYFLNPVLRYDGVQLTSYLPTRNLFKTYACRSSALVILFLTPIIIKAFRNKSGFAKIKTTSN